MAKSPFENCRFQECDLPGQCVSEGKCHHPDLLVTYRRRIAALEAALSEAQRDAERLDWMLDRLAQGESIDFDPRWIPPPPYTNRDSTKRALKDAIDAART